MTQVYPDSNFFIYLFEPEAGFSEAAHRSYDRMRRSGCELASSLFVLSEVLVLPARQNEEFRTASIRRFFRAYTRMLPYTPEAARLYVELRAHHRVKSFDALHLATAAAAGVDLFLTNDTRLHSLTVPGIGQIVGLDHAF